MKPYLIVTGDFVETGGMDVANYALASYLARQGHELHLVAHRVDDSLLSYPNVTFHRVPKPAGSYLLGAPLLDRVGRHRAAKINARGGRVIVNGGNCQWGDVNWVHYVHAAYEPHNAGNTVRRLKTDWSHHRFVANERQALRSARIIIANSEHTKRDIVEHSGVDAERVHTIYYGIDPERFRPATTEERRAARRKLGWNENGITALFIGALGDRRKGFDTLFEVWTRLCTTVNWDVNLVVVGTGSELSSWEARASTLSSSIQFLGFRRDVPTILAASDVLIAPTRYEAYGLGVQEAVCGGLPAIVSCSAGIAERFPAKLHDMLIHDPEDTTKLVELLKTWRQHTEARHAIFAGLSEDWRARTWDEMAKQIVDLVERDNGI